jgi:hypothetical protein
MNANEQKPYELIRYSIDSKGRYRILLWSADGQQSPPNGIDFDHEHSVQLRDELNRLLPDKKHKAAADGLRAALLEIIDQCPAPKLPYGVAVNEIARAALRAYQEAGK